MMKGVLCYAVRLVEGVTVRRVLAVLTALAALVLLPSPAFADQPAVNSMLPTNGDAAGGFVTVISGSGFATGATVRFGAVLSTNVTVAGTTMIIARVPAGVAGSSQIVVITNPDSLAVAVPVQFTYDGAPLSVTSVSPSIGSSFGGTLVAVSGNGFLPGAVVMFGSTPGTSVSVTSPTLLTVVAPTGTFGSVVNVIVTNTSGASAGAQGVYTFGSSTGTTSGSQPTISSVSPNGGSAAGGTVVTIQGGGFLPGALVSFGGTPATNVAVLSSGQITVTAPSGAVGPAALMVTNPGGIFGGLANGFTYLTAVPQVTAVSPVEGVLAGGTPILLTGSGFVVGATVTIGGQPARNVVVTSGTQITAVTPAGAPGSATILITNPGGLITGLATGFTFSATAATPPAPPVSTGTGIAVTSVSPASGPVGSPTLVTIVGQGFLAGAIVTIGGLPATNVTVISSTQILASAPTGATAGAALVVVSNVSAAGAALPNGFTFTAPGAPTPPAPPTTGGTLPPGSSALMVFIGGSNADLVAASGCPSSRVVLWATNAQGQWVGYIPTAPSVINLLWEALFPTGIPANTPFYVRCS